MKTDNAHIPSSLKFMMEVPEGKRYIEENFRFGSDIGFINGISGEDLVGKLEMEKSPRLLDLVSKNFLIKKILESPDLDHLLLALSQKFKIVNLFISTGNKCKHDCKDYCVLKGNPNGQSIDFSKYVAFLDKYSSLLENIGSLHLVGQEFLLMDRFEDYLEEALKRGITTFGIVTRGAGSEENNDSALAKIAQLKKIHPQFKMYLTTSLDRYSTLNAKDHNAMIKNLYKIIKMHLYLFGEKSIRIQSTGSVSRDNGFPEIRHSDMEDITDDMNAILSLLENDGIMHADTEIKPGMTVITMNDGKIIELTLNRRKNVYDEPRLNDVAMSRDESGGTKCEMIDNPFHIYLDKDFNLLTCMGFHDMYYRKKGTLTNVLSTSNEDVLRVLMETRKRAFNSLSYVELAEYFRNPKDIYICDKI